MVNRGEEKVWVHMNVVPRSTLIYTSELILCSTICVPSATRHNIHMYPHFLFAAIHHLKRSKYFFFASCDSLFPITRANEQWVIHGFK